MFDLILFESVEWKMTDILRRPQSDNQYAKPNKYFAFDTKIFVGIF